MEIKPRLLFLACAVLAAAPCVRAEVADSSAPVAAVQQSTAPAQAEKAPSHRGPSLADVYWVPDSARDPFAEVSVRAENGPAAAAKQGKAKNLKFSMDNLQLVGLFATAQGLQAVLSDKENGVSYTLSRGFIYDRKHKPVQNYSGILEGREVTLYGPGNAVKKLRLPEKGKAGKQQ